MGSKEGRPRGQVRKKNQERGGGAEVGGGGGQELGYSLQDLRPREGKDGNTRTGS